MKGNKRLWYVIDTNTNVPVMVANVREWKVPFGNSHRGVWYTPDKMEAKDVRSHYNMGSESLDVPVYRYQIRRGYDHIHGRTE